jgi:hypothetical protein
MTTKVTIQTFATDSTGGTLTPPTPGSWTLVSAGEAIPEQGKPTVLATWTDAALAYANEHAEALALDVTANATADFYINPGRDVTVKALKLFCVGVPASAAGTIVVAFAKNDTDNMLTATNFDLETLVTLTEADLTLSVTTANLDIDEGEYFRIRIVSDNADATGTANLSLRVVYDVR